MIVIKRLISKAINIIEFTLAPTQIIMSGPRATFGNEFKTVKYGSTILERIECRQRRVAMTSPKTEAIIKLRKTSYKVIPMWVNKLPSWNKRIIVENTWVGDEERNELIIWKWAKSSQLIKKITRIKNWTKTTMSLSFFNCFKYFLCSRLYVKI